MVEAPIVHEFQIRENDPWHGEYVTVEGETWFVHAYEFKAYREWAMLQIASLQEALKDTQTAANELVPVCIAEGDNKTAGALQFVSGFISDRLAAIAREKPNAC